MKKSIIAAGLLALFSTTAHPSLTILPKAASARSSIVGFSGKKSKCS